MPGKFKRLVKVRTRQKGRIIEVRIRAKRKATGRPFKKGNTIGKEFRYPPGVSGNKRGTSYTAADAARAFLRAKMPQDPEGRTFAEGMVHSLGYRALGYTAGNLINVDRGCAEVIFDRAEGKPKQDIGIGGTDPLMGILEEMTKRSQKLGKPEGMAKQKDRKADTGGSSKEKE